MKPRGYLLIGCSLAVCGCVDGRPDAGDPEYFGTDSAGEKTGLALQAEVAAQTDVDVATIQYRIDRVACTAGETFPALGKDIRVNLETVLLPGGIQGFDGAPLDGASKHRIADHFEVVPPGCYNIGANPLKGDSAASADCGPAVANRVQVVDGDTAEVFLLSQCAGPQTGAVDAVVAFNQPPQLLNLTFSPSKFVQAGQTTTVCATAIDPNGDQLEFEWAQVGGAPNGTTVTPAPSGPSTPSTPEVPSIPSRPAAAPTAGPAAGNTQCVEITPGAAGDYAFEVRIFDMLRDGQSNPIRFDQYLTEHGSPNRSNDSLRFPVYAAAAQQQLPPVRLQIGQAAHQRHGK